MCCVEFWEIFWRRQECNKGNERYAIIACPGSRDLYIVKKMRDLNAAY